MSFLKNFIPPILTYDNWSNRLYRRRVSQFDQKMHFDSDNFNRTAFVNKAIFTKKNCKYLEIGCDTNDNFNCIPLSSKNKIGLDPSRGGTHKITSDEFFKSNEDKFDVIFIDGLHVYEQCKKDCINSAKSLNDGGIILFHDFLPSDKYVEDVKRPIDKWCGDVWKVGVELSNSKGVDFKIVNIDINFICETPNIKKIELLMKKNLSKLLDISVKNISIKATTNEKIGLIGRGQGIAAESIVQITNE